MEEGLAGLAAFLLLQATLKLNYKYKFINSLLAELLSTFNIYRIVDIFKCH